MFDSILVPNSETKTKEMRAKVCSKIELSLVAQLCSHLDASGIVDGSMLEALLVFVLTSGSTCGKRTWRTGKERNTHKIRKDFDDI